MKRIELAKKSGLAIHKDIQCDSCGVCPIIGDCYKCSVSPDLDFCQQCEATVPHKHPFLKIRRPEQRPDAMFTMVNDEKDTPNPKFVKQCKKKFKNWVQNMKKDLKR